MPEQEQYPPTLPGGQPTISSDVAGVPAECIGDYELIAELAQGGMGIVYRARQRSLNRIVALKMLLPGRVTSDVGRARFRAEAEATAELDHPNIVPIFEVGEHSGRPFFSMKLIDGGTLSDLLRKTPRPPLRELVTAFAKVCRAVQYAHLRGILHRDLKPSNVLLDTAGEPYVADFGLAKRLGSDEGLTITGALLGTPAYMAPEQAGESLHGVTTLTDVYALGAILYEVLTGRPPFATRDLNILLGQIRSEQPIAPSRLNSDTPRDLELICLKCLAKEPGERYASAGELADELERWLRGEPVHIRAPGLVSRVVLWARHNSRAALWVVLIGVIWGLFGLQLPLAIRVYSGPVQRAARALSAHPSAAPSPTAAFLGKYLWLMVLPVAIFVHLAGGMFTYLAMRSRDRWSHLGGGLAVGLIGGVIAFTLYIGPAFVILQALVPATEDIQMLGWGLATREPIPETTPASPEQEPFRLSRFFLEPDPFSGDATVHPQERLLERQPELAEAPEHIRGRLFAAKVRARSFVGIFQGIALGMLVTLVTALPLAIGGAGFADFTVRRGGSIRTAIPLYLEMFALLSLIVVTLVVVILCLSSGWQSHSLVLALWLLLVLVIGFSILAILGRWGQRDRWVTYWVGFGAVVLPTQFQEDWQWKGLVVLLAFTPALILYIVQRMRQRSAESTPSKAPAATDHTRTFTDSGGE